MTPSKGLPTYWLKGVNPKDKEELKTAILLAGIPLNRLKEILEEFLEVSRKEASKADKYELPAWSEYQADKIGEQRALTKVIKLLELDQARK